MEIKAAATQVFPQVTHVLGWNHILQDIKRFAKLHNYTVSDLRDTVHNLMLKKSEAEYLNSLSFTQNWPEALRCYFEKNIDIHYQK